MKSETLIQLQRRFERRQERTIVATPAELMSVPLFSSIPEKVREKIFAADGKVTKFCSFVTLAPGDLIMEQGAYGDSAYVIIEGAVEVLPSSMRGGASPRVRGGAHVTPSSPKARLPEAAGMIGRGQGVSDTIILTAPPAGLEDGTRVILTRGELFGEISALSRYAVSADVRAETEVRLLKIRLRGLKALMAVSKDFKKALDTRYRERALVSHFRQVGIFEDLPQAFIDSLRNSAELVSFEPGQIVVEEGAPAEAFYLVRGGYLKVGVVSGAKTLAISYLRKGDYAGEVGLLIDQPWPFSLQALESVELVKLSKTQFEQVLAENPGARHELWSRMMARLKARGATLLDPASAEYTQMAMDTGLIHGESVLLIDLTTCVQCDECVRGCADAHGSVPRFVREGERYRNWLIPTACYQCTDPTCMTECPTGAITRESDSLIVTINDHTHPTRPCIGCHNCANRCPWGNIIMIEWGQDAGGKIQEDATKCDLCLTRPQGPACVQMCPHGSAVRISFKEVENIVGKLK
ncbi:MAG TPA: cyclic nucleotide-binding domain-containing protein [Vicinamibacteria bacterium]|jgi:CRP-like cAMP-binding protein/Fe-S-cluster-containing dehydrogenase component|nr:cyclic nucleotide-binding domain-containing protein [Vicinamibacteria bacterium]